METRKHKPKSAKAKAAKQGKKGAPSDKAATGKGDDGQTCLRVDGKLLLLPSAEDVMPEWGKIIGDNPNARVEIVRFPTKEAAEAALLVEEEEEGMMKTTEDVEDDGMKMAAVVTPRKQDEAKAPLIVDGGTPNETVGKDTEFGNDLPVLQKPPKATCKEAEIFDGSGLPELPHVKTARQLSPDPPGTSDVFAKRMRESVKNSGMQAVIHLVKVQPGFACVRLAVIDFISPTRKFTHWLHRPPKWVEVFNIFKDSPEGKGHINNFLSYLKSVRLRDPNGDDKPATMTTKGRNGSMKLYQDVFLACIPKAVVNAQVQKYLLGAFRPVLTDRQVQEVYKIAYMGNSDPASAASGMLTPSNPSDGSVTDGKYWSMLQGALEDNCVIVEHQSLDKVLTSEGIVAALQYMAPSEDVTEEDVKKGRIPDGLKMFVYGRG